MSYIGKTPTIGNFQVCDAISVVNNQAAYTMQVGSVNVSPESANHMIVSLNGVIQKPTDAFTVSGSTITFASNLVTGDVINFIQILGNVLDLGVPSDATVTTAKIVDGAVTAAKLASGVGGVAGITSSADATAMTITSAEKIGIGETSPLGLVHIKTADSGAGANGDADELIIENGTSGASAGISILSATNGYGAINFGDSGDDNRGIINYDHPNDIMKLFTSGAERMRISSTGAVKIARNGAAVDSGDYHQIVGNSSNFYEFKVLNKASSPASQYIQEITFASSSPDNSAAKFMQMRDGTTARVNINSDGDLQNHDNSYGGISDERVKQNIVDAGSQWNDIKNIRVRKYKKKDDVAQYGEANAQLEIGVISQELETVSPGLIKEDKADSSHAELHEDFTGDNPQNVKYVKYSILYMKSIKALQEAMERIETLEAKVTTLENE